MIESIYPALGLLWKGMVAVFVVLILIALLVALLKKIDEGRKK